MGFEHLDAYTLALNGEIEALTYRYKDIICSVRIIIPAITEPTHRHRVE